ncbi:MAG: NrdR family transcriptional regulator [Candidatus Saccharibacteria bacterium]|nr:NrdR family transcriptional regulator [Candidatus Saccharibacteria bacterium]
MVCLHCAHDTQVINSRLQKRSNSVWRRRKCLNCQAVFTTIEVAQYHSSWLVSSGTARGALKPFSRDTLLLSIHASLQHRPNAVEDAAALTETIIDKLRPNAHEGLIKNTDIATLVLATLNNFDAVAAVHYRAFHKQ